MMVNQENLLNDTGPITPAPSKLLPVDVPSLEDYPSPSASGEQEEPAAKAMATTGSPGTSPVARRSQVSPQDLARAGLRQHSLNEPELASSTQQPQPQPQDQLTRGSLTVAIPSKSPLHSHVQGQRRATDSPVSEPPKKSSSSTQDQTGGRTSISTTTSTSTTTTDDSPMVRHSAPVDRQVLLDAGLLDMSDNSNLVVPPDQMARMATSRDDAGHHDRLTATIHEVPLPKKIPLKQRQQQRHSHSPVRGRRVKAGSTSLSPARTSQVDPQDISRALGGETASPTNMSILQPILWTRDDNHKSGRGEVKNCTEVVLPKKSPLHSHVNARASTIIKRRRSLADASSLVMEPNELVDFDLSSFHEKHHNSEEDTSDKLVYWKRKHDTDATTIPHNSPVGSHSFTSSPVGTPPRPSLSKATTPATPTANHPTTPPPSTPTTTSGLRRKDNDDAISKFGMRISCPPRQTPPVNKDNMDTSSSHSQVESDNKIKAGLCASRLDYGLVAENTTSGLKRKDNDDAISKFGMRISYSPRQTPPVNHGNMDASSSHSQVESDNKIKAGLRANRLEYGRPGMVTEKKSPAFLRDVAEGGPNSDCAKTTAMLQADAKAKRGLRHYSSANGQQQAVHYQSINVNSGSPIRTTSDHASDARIKAGLRNTSVALATARMLPSEGEGNRMPAESVSSNSNSTKATAATAPLTSDGAPSLIISNCNNYKKGGKSAGLRRYQANADQDGTRFQHGVVSASNSSETATSTNSNHTSNENAKMNNNNNAQCMLPGAYNATTPGEGVFCMERVGSLQKGGMAVLGREGTSESTDFEDSFASHRHVMSTYVASQPSQTVSVDLSIDVSAASLDIESQQQSLKDVPLPRAAEHGEFYKDEVPEKRTSFRCKAILALVTMVAVVGIVVAVVVSSSPSPSSGPDKVDSIDSEPMLPLEQVFENPAEELPAETLVAIQFGEETDPQVQAFQWILNDPNLHLYSMPKRKQRLALAIFYYATNGPYWFNHTDGMQEDSNGWMDYDRHECGWFSLATVQGHEVCKMAPTNGRLALDLHYDFTSLVLSGSNLWTYNNGLPNPRLQGNLVRELALLTSLERLDVGVQKLGGSIPLQLLSLSPTLKEIVLYENHLIGNIPPALFFNATKLWLSFNAFEPSTIPPIGPELTSLALTKSDILGTIPSQLLGSTGLRELYLAENNLSGSIATEIGLATSLTTLELQMNGISSSLPTEVGNLSQLKWLSLEGNMLTGTLASEISRMTSLEYLQLSTPRHPNGDLEGAIPLEFFAAARGNNVRGDVVNGTDKTEHPLAWPNLKSFWLASTHISGSVPTQIGLLTSLEMLVLDGNDKMSGVIPSEIGELRDLEDLGLAAMNLESTIPTEIGLLRNLLSLRLHDNELTGGIPTELASLGESLRFFKIDGNQNLTGPIPKSFCDIEALEIGCTGDGLCGCDCACPLVPS